MLTATYLSTSLHAEPDILHPPDQSLPSLMTVDGNLRGCSMAHCILPLPHDSRGQYRLFALHEGFGDTLSYINGAKVGLNRINEDHFVGA